MPTLNRRLARAVRDSWDPGEVRVETLEPGYEPDTYGGWWVQAQVYVSPMDIHPNPNPAYAVWTSELVSDDGGVYTEWDRDEDYQLESDDDSGTEARRAAHERARYLRKHYGTRGMLVAVRPSDQPPRLHPRPPRRDGN